MKLEDLRYFISVGETGSITRAAQRHFMTQQGMSRIISGMERELCAQLLVRNNNRIRLTPAGEEVMAGAREIEAAYLTMVDAVSRVTRPDCGGQEQDFVIYTTPIMLNTVTTNVLANLNRLFPRVRFAVNEMQIWEMAQNVQFGQDCIALISWPSFRSEMYARVERDALHFEAMYKDRINLGVPKGHPLAGRASVANRELAGLPFATYYNEKDLLQRLLDGEEQPNVLIHSTQLYIVDVRNLLRLAQNVSALGTAAETGNCPVSDPLKLVIERDFLAGENVANRENTHGVRAAGGPFLDFTIRIAGVINEPRCISLVCSIDQLIGS